MRALPSNCCTLRHRSAAAVLAASRRPRSRIALATFACLLACLLASLSCFCLASSIAPLAFRFIASICFETQIAWDEKWGQNEQKKTQAQQKKAIAKV